MSKEMNSRNYDNVPPLASNTVTIATSSTSQQTRMAPTTQIRPMNTVPMRQTAPIRKIMHDSGGASGSGSLAPVQFVHQIKEDSDSMDYQGASTSSGPLIGTSPSNSFQQYQRGVPSASTSVSAVTSGALVMNNGVNNMAMDQPAPVNLASKVAEVFLTAGHAFQKLGDLTLQLHTTTDADESKWSDKEVDGLKNALTRFAHELDQISTCVANRTTRHIKNDIKRRHMMSEEPTVQVKRMTMGSGSGGVPLSSSVGAYTAINSSGMISSGHAVPLGQKRVGMQPIGKLMTTRTVIPNNRFTMAPTGLIPSSAVAINSSQSPSPAGMPQLQSQGGPSSTISVTSQQRIVNSTVSNTMTRVGASQQFQGTIKSVPTMAKRVMTPSTSGSISIPASGALHLEQND